MKFWTSNNLNTLDWLTPQDLRAADKPRPLLQPSLSGPPCITYHGSSNGFLFQQFQNNLSLVHEPFFSFPCGDGTVK